MSITITDATAGLLVLTIDNSGQMYFGDGTPISMLTINGYGIIDSNGHITHGLGSSSVTPASGSANCGISQNVTITTMSGRIPNVQLDTTYPSGNYFIDFRTPGDPTSGGSESVTNNPNQTVHTCDPSTGSFLVVNNNTGDGYVNDPNSQYYDASLATAPFAYRWI